MKPKFERMIKIYFEKEPPKNIIRKNTTIAVISLLLYLFVMFFGGAIIYTFIHDNPKYIENYSETDNLIKTLYTRNGIGLVEKSEFENSIFQTPAVDVYSFENDMELIEDGQPINLPPFLNDFLLITSEGAFTSLQTALINEEFIKNIFEPDEFYNNNYRVYRYLPNSLNLDEDKKAEFFDYFNIENPVFDYETKMSKELNGFGSSIINFILYLILFIGLTIIMFNIIKSDFLMLSSFNETMKASLLGLLILYGVNILGNMIKIIIQALFQERVIDSLNQMAVVDALQSGQAVIMVLSVVFLGPIVEELIFRKAIFSFFRNKHFAIIISSVLFGLTHVLNEVSVASFFINLPSYLIPGLVFGYIYVRNDENIFIPTITHILANLISVLLIFSL